MNYSASMSSVYPAKEMSNNSKFNNSQKSVGDGSSVVLKTLLGVKNDYSMNDANQSLTSDNLTYIGNKNGGISNENEKESDTLTSPSPVDMTIAPKTRGILRSSSVGNSSLSLQDVIEKIIGHRETKVKFAPNVLTRSRSLSMSDAPNTTSNCRVSTPETKLRVNVKNHEDSSPIVFNHNNREGTPESDAGYVTSAQSMSPEYNLNELVKAMTLGYRQNENSQALAISSRTKLPSISEIDPAVSHAVKSPPFPEHAQFDSSNLVSSLSGYPGAPPFHENASQFGNFGANSLLSDRNHVNSLFATHPSDPTSLERAAKLYRNAASLYDASCTWSGQLPPRQHQNPMYSNKVFIGGVPWDISERCLMQAFEQFGNVRIEWPGRGNSPSPPKGYLYIVFESEA